MTRPILYSFRRCPYAMRARLAIHVAGVECELREIILRDKAPEFLAASPKGTVPVVVDGDQVIEESLDVMQWALAQSDPEGWLDMPEEGHALIAQSDGPFKSALDRYKYGSRHPEADTEDEREKGAIFLRKIDTMLQGQTHIYSNRPCLADMAIVTFVRQFAHVDQDWFYSQPWPDLIRWLDVFKASDHFAAIMGKHPKWQAGDEITLFGGKTPG